MSLIRAIHVAKAQLGMDDETYRAFLMNVVGKTSCKGMSEKELGRVLQALEASGFKRQESSMAKKSARKELVRVPQAKKIRALWLMLASIGVVNNPSEEALDAFMRRICGQGLKTATVKQCQAVIECLKKWADRAADMRVGEAFTAILVGDMERAVVLEGMIIAEVQGGIQ